MSKKYWYEQGQKDAGNDKYDPPWGWFPGRQPPGSPERDAYEAGIKSVEDAREDDDE
jgi:hypothetical protein